MKHDTTQNISTQTDSKKGEMKKGEMKEGKKDEVKEEEMVMWVAGIIAGLLVIMIIVMIVVPGKEGSQGVGGLPGAKGPSGEGQTEEGPMGGTGMTGPTGSIGSIGYNRWMALSIAENNTLPYENYTKYVNYYWDSTVSDGLDLYIDGSKYVDGDIFSITNLNMINGTDPGKNPRIYIRPTNFQNVLNDDSTNYWLEGGTNCLNTALIFITTGGNCVVSDSNPNSLLINISYSMIRTIDISRT